MNKEKLLILICCLWIGTLKSQVRGLIVDSEKNEPLIGAIILEKGTTNGIISDVNGEFELAVISEQPVLEINYTLFEPQQLQVEDAQFYHIVMEKDTNDFTICPLIVYENYSRVGYNGGLRNSLIGFRIDNVTSRLWGVNTHLQTNFIYRKGRATNKYVEFNFLKSEVLRFNTRSEISLRGKVSQIEFGIGEFNRIDRQSIIGQVRYINTTIGVGVIRQLLNYEEKSHHGISLLLNQQVLGRTNLELGLDFPENRKQLHISVSQYIPNSGFHLGIKYEKVNLYEEIDLWITYKISY